MRLALLGFYHETNTFNVRPTTYAHFERTGVLRGAEIIEKHGEAKSTAAGYLAMGAEMGAEVVPLYFTNTEPMGLIERDAFERICDESLAMLRDQGPWDGVLLVLHGAAVADGYPDADGEYAARARAIVGPDVPIGISMDLHGNITQRMVDAVTVVNFYRTNPHLDSYERGRECAALVVRAVRGEVHPVMALETPPLVVNIVKQFTGEEPMQGLMADVDKVIARPGMLSASAVMGFPYADVEEMGMTFLAVHDGDPAAARDAAQWLADQAWERRNAFVGDTPSPDDAIRRAMDAPRGPVVLMDVGDNIGGGSSADSTVLLESALRLGARSYVQSLYDPGAVAACVAAGVGSVVTLTVGAKTDDLSGDPITVTGRVRVLSDGKFEETGPIHGGFRFFDGGTTAVLECENDITLVLTSERVGNMSLAQMHSVGVFPERKQIAVAKGVHSPRPAYGPIAAEVILVNTPGATSSDLSTFTYHHRRRPLFPFEPDATY